MIDDDGDLRTFALLSMQRALWDVVTPSLRSVSVGWQSGVIQTHFCYDQPIDDEIRELVGEAETEVIADLHEGMGTDFIIEYCPTEVERTLPAGDAWVYLRREAEAE